MAEPKKRLTSTRSGHRRSHQGQIKVQLNRCSRCGEPKLQHRVCPNCGYYNGEQVIKKQATKTKK